MTLDQQSAPTAATNGEARPSGPSQQVKRRVLIVEDNEDTRTSFQQLLEVALNVEVETAPNGAEGIEMLTRADRPFSIVIADLRMPKVSGMELMEEIHRRKLPVTVIVTTGHGSVSDAVRAMRLGAYDFLTKPPDPQHFCLLVERALRERTLQDELAALRAQIDDRHSFKNVLSKNPRMFEIFDLIDHLADTTTTVLINGETGTGKEQVALAIHHASAKHRPGPFVAINCAAMSETLLESELFGHEKGSFTGAATQRKGRFEIAHTGTLFLDEVGDIPTSMQVKLLRVLQDRRFERVGGNQPIEVDVRVIAATNRDLLSMVGEGKFREDLYYRLNVVQFELPPLRERTEDIPLLAAHFARNFARPDKPAVQIAPEAMELLLRHPWPGNVRQLENAIERACLTARDGLIQPENLPPEVRAPARSKTALAVDLDRPLPDQLAELTACFEQRYLREAMKRCRGQVGRCAQLAGLSRRSVSSKLGQYKIDASTYK